MMEVMGCAVAGRLPLQQYAGEGPVIGSEEAQAAVQSAIASLRDAVANPERYISEKAEQQFASIRDYHRRAEILNTLSGKKCSWETDTFRERGYIHCASLREALKKEDRSDE
jgi:hypothetical protein